MMARRRRRRSQDAIAQNNDDDDDGTSQQLPCDVLRREELGLPLTSCQTLTGMDGERRSSRPLGDHIELELQAFPRLGK